MTVASVQQWNLGHRPGAVGTAIVVLGLFAAWSFGRSRGLVGPAGRPRTLALIVAPYYNKPSQEGLYRHYRAIARSTRLPIVLYSIPGRCGVEIGVETTRRLAADCKNIVAIKEAGGSVDRVSQLRAVLPKDFTIISGDDALTLPFLAAGAVVVLASGFVEQRHYLERRYENLSPALGLANAVRWGRDLRDARIAISGVRGVFNQYAFYGTDLSNHVQWLGDQGPDGAFNRIPNCAEWRQAVNDGDYDFVVTMYDPYAPGRLTDTKEALWTRLDPNAKQVLRNGPVSIFQINGPLDPSSCGNLPALDPSELDGDSVNLDPNANQPYAKDLLPKAATPGANSGDEEAPR